MKADAAASGGLKPGPVESGGLKAHPAERLALVLLAGGPDLRRRAEAPLADRRLAWSTFETSAVSWGLAPFLLHRLREAGLTGRVPASIVTRFQEIERLTAVRNTLLLHHLGRLARLFAGAGIPVIVLKGGEFLTTLYPRPSLRVMVDLDLLVPRAEVPRAEATLAAAGFTGEPHVGREWFDRHLHHAPPWTSADGGAVVELHWALTRANDPFAFDEAELWSRARPHAVGSAEIRRLSLPDSVEYLAAHLFRHLTTPDGALRSLADLALLLDAEEGRGLDWAAQATLARRHGTRLPLALALTLLARARPEDGFEARAAVCGAGLDPAVIESGVALLDGLFTLPSRQSHVVVSGVTGLGQARGLRGKARFLRGGVLPAPADVNRDLSPGQARLPLPLRYPLLLVNHARELFRVGPRAAVAAYRLGRLRRVLMEDRDADRSQSAAGDRAPLSPADRRG